MAEMVTAADIHDFGVEVVFGFLQRDGWDIVSVNTKVGIDPQIVAKRGGQLAFIVVRTDVYPYKGSLDAAARKAMAEYACPA